MIVLVGGAGFIGHNLALAYAKQGRPVTVIDSLMINNLYALKDADPFHIRMLEERLRLLDEAGIPVIRMDARDYSMLSETMSALRPTKIIHLAAIAHLDRANKSPFNTFDHSLRTLENSLDVARALNVERFVYFSSSTVYGDFTSDSVYESSPTNPRGIYGSLKLAGELMVRAYTEICKLNATIVRPCGLYGPRCVSGRVVQKFIEAALFNEPLKLRGNETVDFTYIDDLVRGVMLAAEAKEAIGETFNITAGQAHSILELAQMVREHFPGTVILHESSDPERPKRGTLEVHKAAQHFGYAPQFPLRRGVEEYVRWYKSLDIEKPAQLQAG